MLKIKRIHYECHDLNGATGDRFRPNIMDIEKMIGAETGLVPAPAPEGNHQGKHCLTSTVYLNAAANMSYWASLPLVKRCSRLSSLV